MNRKCLRVQLVAIELAQSRKQRCCAFPRARTLIPYLSQSKFFPDWRGPGTSELVRSARDVLSP